MIYGVNAFSSASFSGRHGGGAVAVPYTGVKCCICRDSTAKVQFSPYNATGETERESAKKMGRTREEKMVGKAKLWRCTVYIW